MEDSKLFSLKYPIGTFSWKSTLTEEERLAAIRSIASFSRRLEQLLADTNAQEREWPYRPKGWNTRQLVHHCADSHLNALVRFKWALSEEEPLIKAYKQEGWAADADYQEKDLSNSLQFLESLHKRWVQLIESLDATALARRYKHPEHAQMLNLEGTIAMYAWHCEHHLAHIKLALASEGKHF